MNHVGRNWQPPSTHTLPALHWLIQRHTTQLLRLYHPAANTTTRAKVDMNHHACESRKNAALPSPDRTRRNQCYASYHHQLPRRHLSTDDQYIQSIITQSVIIR
jgi:hypothetical protein